MTTGPTAAMPCPLASSLPWPPPTSDAPPPYASSSGWRVTMLITPPIASEPYSVDCGPFTTSTRSIIDVGTRETSVMPAMRPMNGWPSSSTSTRSEPRPWSMTPEPAGMPPCSSTPVRSVSTAARSVAPVRWISARDTSSVGTAVSASACGRRPAVTTSASRSSGRGVSATRRRASAPRSPASMRSSASAYAMCSTRTTTSLAGTGPRRHAPSSAVTTARRRSPMTTTDAPTIGAPEPASMTTPLSQRVSRSCARRRHGQRDCDGRGRQTREERKRLHD